MTIETAEPGLRERKRLATRRAIQMAALTIASERGLDAVTVDEIGRVADISPRTFFNYFPTKEAAIVGDGLELPADDAVEEFVAAAPQDLLAGVARLLTLAAEHAADDAELTARRRVLVKANPQLFALRVASMHSFELQLVEVVERRVARDEPGLSPAQRLSKARLVTFVAIGAMRHAWVSWADAGGVVGLGVGIDDSFAELRHLLA